MTRWKVLSILFQAWSHQSKSHRRSRFHRGIIPREKKRIRNARRLSTAAVPVANRDQKESSGAQLTSLQRLIQELAGLRLDVEPLAPDVNVPAVAGGSVALVVESRPRHTGP